MNWSRTNDVSVAGANVDAVVAKRAFLVAEWLIFAGSEVVVATFRCRNNHCWRNLHLVFVGVPLECAELIFVNNDEF
jgi:hypothetical protein